MASWIVLFYGILVAALGTYGYVHKSSLASLISGGISGIVLIGSAVAMMKDWYSVGWWLALIVTIALIGRFGPLLITKGFTLIPGGTVVIAGLVVLAVLFMYRGR